MTPKPTLIELLQAGTEAVRAVTVPVTGAKVALVVLSRALEVDMLRRAREWCATQVPPITADDLIKLAEQDWLLWKSLVHPDEPWTETGSGRMPHLVFESAGEMRQKLTGTVIDWLDDQLYKFRAELSPFAGDRMEPAVEAALERIAKEAHTPQGFVDVFTAFWCARHGRLLTERAVREMSPDLWMLYFYSLPPDEYAALLSSPLMVKLRGEIKEEAKP